MTDASVLDDLWARFGHIARRRVDVLQEAVTVLHAHATDPEEAAHVGALRASARDECHKLVGALDSYGRTGGSALAARAEQLLALRPDAPGLHQLEVVLAGLAGLFDPEHPAATTCTCVDCGHVHLITEEHR